MAQENFEPGGTLTVTFQTVGTLIRVLRSGFTLSEKINRYIVLKKSTILYTFVGVVATKLL